ncbi:MAG TPA: hypothetical protein VHJ17_12205 [Thermomonospora sp.]|nr:hypothetical protein [Thermomonospora sp.]
MSEQPEETGRGVSEERSGVPETPTERETSRRPAGESPEGPSAEERETGRTDQDVDPGEGV